MLKNNQNGYAMLFAVVLTVLFLVLGLSLITINTNSMSKNEHREDKVQAQNLSEMGLENAINELYISLQKKVDNASGMSITDFSSSLNTTLDDNLCAVGQTPDAESYLAKVKNNLETPAFKKIDSTNTGEAYYCILSYKNTKLSDGITDNPLRKDTVFLSKGISDGEDYYLITKTLVGTNTVPDILTYAVGTQRSATGAQNGDGDLIALGGIQIEGDVYVAGNLLTGMRTPGPSSSQWIASPLVTIVPYGTSDGKAIANKAKVIVDKNLFTFAPETGKAVGDYDVLEKKSATDLKINSTSKTVTLSGINSKIYAYNSEKQNLEKVINSNSKAELIVREPKKTIINIHQEISDASKQIKKVSVEKSLTNNGTIEKATFGSSTSVTIRKPSSNGLPNFKLKGDVTFHDLYVPGNLRIDSNANLELKKHSNGGGITYIEGDLCIGTKLGDYNVIDGLSATCKSSTGTASANVKLEGAYYVNGNVWISGANIETNAIIYTNKQFEIKNATVKGKSLQNGKTGNLIIFSKESIDISGINVYADPPNVFNGFYYTEGEMRLWGKGVNLEINGGISGKRIYLYGTRGIARETNTTNNLVPYLNQYFESLDAQQTKSSRLTIKYNPEIMETYSDLRQKEQVIYTVDPTEVYDKKIY